MADLINKQDSKKTNKAISFFLTDEIEKSLLENRSFEKIADQFIEQKLHQDWQKIFCNTINYHRNAIPWNLLRAEFLELARDYKTIVCCDPISIQMTHRGAYCWGQQGLNLSKKDASTLVVQINDILMDEGEQFLLSNNLEWLYVSDKLFTLDEPSFERLIGKDLFAFRYKGDDATKWSSLATEIQMLIKQLTDYGKIESRSSETDISVHFWGDTRLTLDEAFPSQNKNGSPVIYSSNSRLNYFIQRNHLLVKPLQQLAFDFNADLSANSVIVVAPNFSSIPDQLIQKNTKNHSSVKIITQDKILINKTKVRRTMLQKLRSLFMFNKSYSN